MKPFDDNYFLGYVNEVTPQFIKIHYPAANLLGEFNHLGVNYPGGNVGHYAVIEGDEYGFLAKIVEVNLPDSEKKSLSEKAMHHKETDFHPAGKAELVLSFSVYEPEKVQKTISKFPQIGAKVYSCSDEQIGLYIKEFGKKADENEIYAELGKLTSNNATCNISLNALFGRHCAIIGTTGGGKSWTVAKLIEGVVNNSNNKVILIDATGEYSRFECRNLSFGKNCFFDYKYLSNSEFCFLFQENSPNTVATLCEAINSLKLVSMNIDNYSGVKVGRDAGDINKLVRENTHKFKGHNFDINKLSEQVKNECVKINRSNKYEEDNFKLGYCSHLIARINLLLQNDTIKGALGMDKKEGISEVIEQIEEFLSKENKQTILRIGFENLSYDFSIREIIVDFIASHLLKKSRNNSFKESPIILFIDEAHQFLNKRVNAEDNSIFFLQNVDLIAKECRKYGLFLCLSTQMPRDIPVGTLSQIGTFIVHRIINEQDKRAIENACSAVNRYALTFLPILGEGEALLVGVDFPMPLTLKINEPRNKPKSDTPTLNNTKGN